jgi:hypothetical protein
MVLIAVDMRSTSWIYFAIILFAIRGGVFRCSMIMSMKACIAMTKLHVFYDSEIILLSYYQQPFDNDG